MRTAIRKAAGDAVGAPWQTVRVALRPAPGYQSNRLYDAHAAGRHLIVKEFLKPDEFQEAPVREFEGLRLLASLDVAPQPLLLRPHGPQSRPLVVYEFMPGEMWDRRRPQAGELQDLAALWLQVNEVTAEHLWPSRGFEAPLMAQMARFEAMFEAYAGWAREAFPPALRAAQLCLSALRQRQAVVRELQNSRSVLCFCRADARFANVIARPDGRLGMVDWEDCGLRDAALDLADVVTAPNQEDLLNWNDWQPLLQTYLAGRERWDARLAQRAHLYLALYPLAWLGWLLSAGVARARDERLAGWRIHEMAADEKLRRYLARARGWPAMDFAHELQALHDVQFFPQLRK